MTGGFLADGELQDFLPVTGPRQCRALVDAAPCSGSVLIACVMVLHTVGATCNCLSKAPVAWCLWSLRHRPLS